MKKVAGIVLIVLGVFCLLMFVIGIGFSFLVVGLLCLLIAYLSLKKPAKQAGGQASERPTQPVAVPSPAVAPENVSGSLNEYSFNVAGISYHQSDIIQNLVVEVDDYKMSKREIVEMYEPGERIYRYEDTISEIELVPEPDNEYDPNAIRVEADGIAIGYVPREKTGRVKKVMESSPMIEWDLCGGPYKELIEDWDDERNREIYSINTERDNIGMKIILKY